MVPAKRRATLEKAVLDIFEKISLNGKLFKAGSGELDQIKDILKEGDMKPNRTDESLPNRVGSKPR